MQETGYRPRGFPAARIAIAIALATLTTARCRKASERLSSNRQQSADYRIAADEAPAKPVADPERIRKKGESPQHWLDDLPEAVRKKAPERAPALPAVAPAGPGNVSSSTDGSSPRRCSFVEPAAVRIWPTPAPVTVVAALGRFLVAGYCKEESDERIFLVAVAPRKRARPLATVRLHKAHPARRAAAPGISVKDGVHALLAATDGSGAVLAGSVPLERATANLALSPVGAGADTRFPPAVAHFQGLSAVAWCTGSTPMRTQVALLGPGNAVMATYDVTPTGLGASAPVFVEGSDLPLLLALDAHDGYSPLLRIAFSATGVPAEATVVTPLNLIAIPPRLVAARAPFGVLVAYTALGTAATSAVGLLPVEPEVGPLRALVRGTGYGRLQVDVAAAPQALIFAADAPVSGGSKDQREIRVRVADQRGIGPVLLVRGPADGTAEGAALARGADGTIALAFSSGSGVYLHWLACDDR